MAPLMDLGEGPSHLSSDNTREDTIQVGNTLLLKLPSGDVKTWKLEKDSCDTVPLILGTQLSHVTEQQIWENLALSTPTSCWISRMA